MNGQLKGAMIATAAASLFFASAALAQGSAQTNQKAEAQTVHCQGINACKGQGSCNGPGHGCNGENACKGKGWVETTAKECKAKGGTILKE